MISLFLATLLHYEIVTNGTFDVNHYRSILEKGGVKEEIISCDLTKIPGLEKKKKAQNLSLDPSVKKILFMNIPRNATRNLQLEKLPKEKLILFMWEPPIRLRKMYAEKVQKCFSKIYTFNDDLVDGKTYFKFYYPEKKEMLDNLPPFEEKKFLTMIVGKASDKSRHHPNELYSHRNEAITFFQDQEEDFDFYGRGWSKEDFHSYRGEISDKLSVNKNYKFSICYENCRDVPGYITEKIFDCFAAGSIPIYWGANNITDYIPKECFIDKRNFSSYQELYQFLKEMTKEEYEGYLSHIRAYLKSEKSAPFSQENYEKTILEALK